MAKKKQIVEEVAAEVIVEESLLPEAEAEVSSKGSAKVVFRNGNDSRVYTKELHGKDFAEIAKGFAKKVGGKVV